MAALIIVIAHGWHVAAGSTVKLAGDWVGDVAQFLLLFLEVFGCGFARVFFYPIGCLFDGFQKLLNC